MDYGILLSMNYCESHEIRSELFYFILFNTYHININNWPQWRYSQILCSIHVKLETITNHRILMVNFQQRIDHRENFPLNTRTRWTQCSVNGNKSQVIIKSGDFFFETAAKIPNSFLDVCCITGNKFSFRFRIVLFEVDEVHETKKVIDSMQWHQKRKSLTSPQYNMYFYSFKYSDWHFIGFFIYE